MAVNPLPFLQNMPDPGQAFLQAFNQARAQRDQKIAQQSRQAQYAQWIERLKVDRSPPTLMEFNLAFPEMADAIKKAFEPLDEASKQARLGYATQALSALERGDAETAKTMANELYTAAKNTPGQEQFAEELKFGIELMDTKPDILKVGLSNGIFNGDQKRYETFYKREKEQPYVVVPGVGLFLRRDIDAAIAAGDKGSVTDPNVRPKVPQAAIDDLRKNPGTAAQFDEVFGPGAAAAALGMEGTPAPAEGATTLTPEQYRVTVQAMGKAKTDDWMRRNNITVSGQ